MVDLKLTKRQQEIFDFIKRYSAKHGYPPTVRDIGKAIGLGSPSTVHAHLTNLEKLGLLRRDPSKPRAAGEGYVVTDGGCGLPGGVEPNSAAFHIVQSKDQVLIVRENPGLPRTIHLDGRVHPHLTRWTANAVGHSVGRYEGGALVVVPTHTGA